MRALLVKGCPVTIRGVQPLLPGPLGVVSIGVKGFTGLAIVRFKGECCRDCNLYRLGDDRHLDDVPRLGGICVAIALQFFDLTDQPADEVGINPTGVSDELAATGFFTGVEHRGPPVVKLTTEGGGFGLLPVLDRVVNIDEVGRQAGALADACPPETTKLGGNLPAALTCAAGVKNATGGNEVITGRLPKLLC